MAMSRNRFGLLLAAFGLASFAGCGDQGSGAAASASGWVRHVVDAEYVGADGVRVSDVNGDGLVDVVTGWEESGLTRAYLHPGYEAVTEPWAAVTVGSTPDVEDASWADVDGDGRTDVVSSCEGRTKQVFISFAPGDPKAFLEPREWHTVKIAAASGRQWMYALPLQIDGKNGVDLVVGSKGRNAVVAWLEAPPNPRDPAAWKLHEVSPAGWVMSITAMDMNGDGIGDLLVSDRSHSPVRGIRWLENPGPDSSGLAGPWVEHPIGAQDRNPVFIAPVVSADSTGPVRIVVPAGRNRLSLFERLADGSDFWRETPLPFPPRAGDVKAAGVGDIDMDGQLDIVLTCTNVHRGEDGIVWFPNPFIPEQSRSQARGISGPGGRKFDRLELLDLDADGDLDVLTTEEVERLGVIWYENPTY